MWICKIPRGAVLFVLGCMACAAAFLAYVLPGMGLTVFLQRVSLILNDPQYDFTTSQRLALLGSQALNTAKFLAKPLAASVVLCLLLWAKTHQKRDWIGLALNLWAILAAQQGQARGAAVLAGLSAGHGGVCVHSALYAAGLFGYLYVSDLARALRLLCHVGVQAGESGAGKTAPGPVCAGGAAGIFADVPVLVRSGNGLEACQCGNSQPEADHRRPRRRDLGGRKSRRYADGPVRSAGTLCGQAGAAGYWRVLVENSIDYQHLYEALEPFAGKQVLQAIGEQHGLGFMMAGGTLTIGQASVISGTDSDPRFIQYYEELPEKRPDVILYDEAEVRDMAAFHAWIEENFTITARYPVTHGTAHLQVLVVD